MSLPPASPAASSKAGSSAADASNRPFMHEMQAARFFYMDQFVILSNGSKVILKRVWSVPRSDGKEVKFNHPT